MAALLVASAGCGPKMDTPAPVVPVQSRAPAATTAGATAVIAGEAHLFRGTRAITTAFPIDRVVRLYSFDDHGREIDFAASDWSVGNGRLARTPASHVPDFATYRYSTRTGCAAGLMACLRALRYPAKAGGFDIDLNPRNPPPTINFNVYVDYVARTRVPLVKARRAGTENARRVVCIGDSITAGSHTIDLVYHHRDDQSWCGLLRRHFALSSANPAVAGSFVTSLNDQLAGVDTDLVVIAFGMNDHAGGDAGVAAFTARLDDAVKRLRQRRIKAILVGFFQQNELWIKEDRRDTIAYNRAIAGVAAANHVPFVDPLSAFARLAGDAPPAYDLTGDWLHHPNVYGQRIYYSLLVPYFLRDDTPADRIADYVLAVGDGSAPDAH